MTQKISVNKTNKKNEDIEFEINKKKNKIIKNKKIKKDQFLTKQASNDLKDKKNKKTDNDAIKVDELQLLNNSERDINLQKIKAKYGKINKQDNDFIDIESKESNNLDEDLFSDHLKFFKKKSQDNIQNITEEIEKEEPFDIFYFDTKEEAVSAALEFEVQERYTSLNNVNGQWELIVYKPEKYEYSELKSVLTAIGSGIYINEETGDVYHLNKENNNFYFIKQNKIKIPENENELKKYIFTGEDIKYLPAIKSQIGINIIKESGYLYTYLTSKEKKEKQDLLIKLGLDIFLKEDIKEDQENEKKLTYSEVYGMFI